MAIQKEIPHDPRDTGRETLAPIIDIVTQKEVISPQEEAARDEEGINIPDRRTAKRSEKRRRKRLLRWGLGVASSVVVLGAAGIGIAHAVSPSNKIDSNTLPTPVSEPSKLPITVPTVETPEITVPRSFKITEESSVKFSPEGRPVGVIEKKGTVRQGINTMPLTADNLDSIVKNSPDSFSNELYALNRKYIYFPIASDKDVTFKTTIADREVYRDGDSLIKFEGAGGTVFPNLHNGDEVKLFIPKAEVFRLPPLVAEGKEYYTKLLLKETLSNGEVKFYETEIYRGGNALDVEIADEFKNAPVIQGDLSRLWLNQAGQLTSMTVGEDDTLTAPSLLKIKKDGISMIIFGLGNTELEFYTAPDENNDTKIVKPS